MRRQKVKKKTISIILMLLALVAIFSVAAYASPDAGPMRPMIIALPNLMTGHTH